MRLPHWRAASRMEVWPARCSWALPGGSTTSGTEWNGISAHSGILGVLGRFVGMLTDSRSLVSYPRHEYFRRILCNLLGGWMEAGELPYDMAVIGGIVKDICHRNAEAYFGF